MKFERKLIAPLALSLALSACGGGADEADDTATATPEATETVAMEGAVATPTEEATSEETPSEEASATATPTPPPSPSKSAAAAPAAKATVAAAAPATPPPAFAQCSVCHSTEPGDNGIGPSLAGVFGTKAGEVPGYKFSPAMKDSGLTWDAATLDTYLTDPRKMVPGTTMGFGGMKDDAKRKAVIDFLKSIR